MIQFKDAVPEIIHTFLSAWFPLPKQAIFPDISVRSTLVCVCVCVCVCVLSPKYTCSLHLLAPTSFKKSCVYVSPIGSLLVRLSPDFLVRNLYFSILHVIKFNVSTRSQHRTLAGHITLAC